MKLFLITAAIIACAQALPTEIDQRAENRTADFFDGSRAGIMGFATLHGGTRGGQGGQIVTVWDAWQLRDAVTGDTPRIINVRGRIDLSVLFTGSPGVSLQVGSWKTIQGGDRSAEITGGGLLISNKWQVIIRNIIFTNAISYAPGERPNGSGGIAGTLFNGLYSEIDAIGIDGSTLVWIDHNEFSDDPWDANNTPLERQRHDGLIDIKLGASYITITNNIFRNHDRVTLVGHADNNAAQDTGRLRCTFAYNWYRGVTQRNPRVRYGQVHVLNNLYTDIRSYGVGAGAGANIFLERNAFVNSRRAWGFPAGIPNPMGNVQLVNNHLVNSGFDSGVPSNVNFNPANFYWYNPIGSTNVEAYVRANAGPWR